jgi:hypothetical protein
MGRVEVATAKAPPTISEKVVKKQVIISRKLLRARSSNG